MAVMRSWPKSAEALQAKEAKRVAREHREEEARASKAARAREEQEYNAQQKKNDAAAERSAWRLREMLTAFPDYVYEDTYCNELVYHAAHCGEIHPSLEECDASLRVLTSEEAGDWDLKPCPKCNPDAVAATDTKSSGTRPCTG